MARALLSTVLSIRRLGLELGGVFLSVRTLLFGAPIWCIYVSCRQLPVPPEVTCVSYRPLHLGG